jgi:two-component sensor histidine kinase
MFDAVVENSSNGGILRLKGSLKKNSGDLMLKVSDNGVGLPKDLDFRDTKTFGMQLVNTLVDQLGGAIELKSERGTEFTIMFSGQT